MTCFSNSEAPKKPKTHGQGNKVPEDIDFAALLAHFSFIQGLHEEERSKKVSQDVATEDEASQLSALTLNDEEKVEFSMIDE